MNCVHPALSLLQVKPVNSQSTPEALGASTPLGQSETAEVCGVLDPDVTLGISTGTINYHNIFHRHIKPAPGWDPLICWNIATGSVIDGKITESVFCRRCVSQTHNYHHRRASLEVKNRTLVPVFSVLCMC